jgi:hypothetical protein
MHTNNYDCTELETRPAPATFSIRIAPELLSEIAERAQADHRSRNQEIIYLLEQALYPLKYINIDGPAENREVILKTFGVTRV